MGRRKKEPIEFRYYDVPQDEPVLALLGERWDRTYGHDTKGLHFHNLMEIGWCQKGEGELLFGENALEYKEGSWTIIPANYPHTTYSYGEETNFWEFLFFDPLLIAGSMEPEDPSRVRKLRYWVSRGAYLFQKEEEKELFCLVGLVMEEMRKKKPHYRESVRSLMEALIFLIIRMNEERSTDIKEKKEGVFERFGTEDAELYRIASVIDYVDAHFSQTIYMKELADVCSMSETHLRRLFESIMHMSPAEYVCLVRVQKACDLLKKTDDSLDLIAGKCGFESTSTFQRSFKKLVGISPFQWKKLPGNYERGLMEFKVTAIRGW